MITKPFAQVKEGTQCYMILQHLRLGKSITGVEALHLYKVRDLPKRISELTEDSALVVNSEWKTDTTGARYKRYWLRNSMIAILNGEMRA